MMHLKSYGDLHQYEKFLVFFGNRTGTLEAISPHFPSISILKQTHGDKLIKSESGKRTVAQQAVQQGSTSPLSPHLPEADAQWTQDQNYSMGIKTADCMPVMICSPQSNIALGIHSGWRGVQQRIVAKAISTLNLQQDPKLKVFIGPHIQHKSFEVGADVALALLSAHDISYQGGNLTSTAPQFEVFMKDRKTTDLIFEANSKFYINLSALVSWELLRLYIPAQQIWVSDKDTKTDKNYFSYRRGEKGVSNYSLVTRMQ